MERPRKVPGPIILAVIPARLQSTRLPNKPLLKIGEKPMIQRVWERTKLARRIDRVVIATDSSEIQRVAEGFGAEVAMTDPGHTSGTDRVAEVAESVEASLVINVQGDEPLIDPTSIDLAIEPMMGPMLERTDVVMCTLMKRFDDPEEVVQPSVVKVVTDRHGNALYFSRSPIPCRRDPADTVTWYKHLGLYVYQRDFLLRFPKLPRGPLEAAEKLEQLRVMENGYKIRVVETVHDSIGVDTEEDLARARALAAKSHQDGIQERTHV